MSASPLSVLGIAFKTLLAEQDGFIVTAEVHGAESVLDFPNIQVGIVEHRHRQPLPGMKQLFAFVFAVGVVLDVPLREIGILGVTEFESHW